MTLRDRTCSVFFFLGRHETDLLVVLDYEFKSQSGRICFFGFLCVVLLKWTDPPAK
jgi:hypothetical protein